MLMALTEETAVEIYRCKIKCLGSPSSFKSLLEPIKSRLKGQSTPVAGQFGVSPKTIRDIWNHRTWVHATEALWIRDDVPLFPSQVSQWSLISFYCKNGLIFLS